jgi:hypothetical protein
MKVNPAHLEMKLLVDAVPGVVIDRDGAEFNHEEDPLHGPAEDEVVNERAGGFRMSEADGEPDANAGDGAEDGGQDEKKLGVPGQLREPGGAHDGIGHAHGFALGDGEIEAAADSELRNHHVEDGDEADHPAGTEIGDVPKWIVHGKTPVKK